MDLICRKCEESKEKNDFYERKKGIPYLTECKKCRREREKKWKLDHKEESIAYARMWRLKNKENHKLYLFKNKDKIKKQKRERYKNDSEFRERHKDWGRKTRYGMECGTYAKLFSEQKGVCAVCGNSQKSKKSKNLYVDHNHKTGKIRGLVCTKCNCALGLVNEDKKVLNRLINYLESHEEDD